MLILKAGNINRIFYPLLSIYVVFGYTLETF